MIYLIQFDYLHLKHFVIQYHHKMNKCCSKIISLKTKYKGVFFQFEVLAQNFQSDLSPLHFVGKGENTL